jgi:hypothetical protein
VYVQPKGDIMNRIRYSIWIMAIFFALILSALNVAPALADEAPPPDVSTPAETGEEAAPPAEGTTDTASSAESSSVAEVIESLPADTTLVVVDENGEAIPLASEEAAETIAVADPQWCPVGVVPGSPTCSGTKTSFNGTNPLTNLIQWLKDNQPNKAGVIWIEAGYVGTTVLETSTVILNGADYTDMDNFALTINGGWTGTGTTLNPNTPSTFNVAFVITGWNGAITINNIAVTGVSNTLALSVQTTGNITLNNVDVVNNTTLFSGARLDNESGTGNVTVNDSTFNNNTGVTPNGLTIISKGTVTLKNVTANGNSGYGVYIENHNAATPKAVTINGTNHFSYNGWDGLRVKTKGAITLNNITAMGNTQGHGAYLDNCSFNYTTDVCTYGVANGVTIKGSNNFSNNGHDGLRVFSGGVITVSNITANGNGTHASRPTATSATDNFDAGGKGALLHNFGASTPKNIVISGTNTFNNNASAGLLALGWGSVTVNNITANSNGCNLTYEINDTYCAGAYLEGQRGITQTGYGRFENNTKTGFYVYALGTGAVTLNNLYVDNNGDVGADIDAFGNVTLNGINTFNNNDWGLNIGSDGVITLNNITANGNLLNGAYIYNASSATPKAVTIKGVNNFNDNGYNGINISSSGAITMSNFTANNNTVSGVSIDNAINPATPFNVTITGNNIFNNNDYGGLEIFTYGAVVLNNITANNNQSVFGYGVYIDNNNGSLARPVTINGTNRMNSNVGTGLRIDSLGAIKINNLMASYNMNGSGALLDNNDIATISQPVTITGYGIFNENLDMGLVVNTNGNVVFANISANLNGNGGANIYAVNNATSASLANVSLTGINTFNGNMSTSGLVITTDGAITVSNITANSNVGYGASLDNLTNANSGPTGIKAVTLSGVNMFNNNVNGGLYIYASGNVTLTRITANYNNDPSLPAAPGVTVYSSLGNIVFTCGSLNNNEGKGYFLNVAGVGKTITLKGVYTFGNGISNSAIGATTITRACPLP